MNGVWIGWRRMERKVREKVTKKGFSEKVTFELKSKKEAVMNVLQEKFQKEETPGSQGMDGFGMLEDQGGQSVVEAAQGNGDSRGGRDLSPNRDMMRTKYGK